MSESAAHSQTTNSPLDRLEPWEDDGNIVLAVQGKYFRVHRSILRAYSEVFKDMFNTCSHSNEAEESIEECPVIHLQDEATDIQIVLKALYDRGYPMPRGQLSISVAAAFLHLGEKYAIQALSDEAKAKVCRSIEPKLRSAGAPLGLNLFPKITGRDPHNFQIMNLLQERGLKAPLPLAMYQCIFTCPLTVIADGYEFNGSVCSLSPANIRAFILMRGVLEKHRVQLGKLPISEPPVCSRMLCWSRSSRLWTEDINGVLPLDSWKSDWSGLFCDSCRVYYETKRQRIVNQTWDQLPTVFGFDSWGEVKKGLS